MVGRLGDDAVEIAVFQHLAQILFLLRLEAAELLDLGGGPVARARIDVAHVGDLDARHLHRSLHDGLATPLFVAAHDSQPHAIRSGRVAKRTARRSDRKGACARFDKVSSVHVGFPSVGFGVLRALCHTLPQPVKPLRFPIFSGLARRFGVKGRRAWAWVRAGACGG